MLGAMPYLPSSASLAKTTWTPTTLPRERRPYPIRRALRPVKRKLVEAQTCGRRSRGPERRRRAMETSREAAAGFPRLSGDQPADRRDRLLTDLVGLDETDLDSVAARAWPEVTQLA